MKNKFVGIFLCMLLIATILPVTGTNPIKNEDIKEIIWLSSQESSDSFQKNQDFTTNQPIYWLYFHNDNLSWVFGLAGGGTFEWAARFTQTDLDDWSGYKISVVRYYHSWSGNPFDMDGTVKIYEEGTSTEPGDLISSENFTANGYGWIVIELSKPVYIDGDKDIWVSIEGTHSAGEYPAALDSGPAVDGKGDWMYTNSSGWEEIQDGGADYNFVIQAGISPIEGTGPIPILELEYKLFGLGGISLLLNNIGEGTAYNIIWDLKIEPKIWFNIVELHGDENDLGPDDSMTISTSPIVGIGPANIRFICNYTMDINTSRDELDGGVKQDGVDWCFLFVHTFAPNQNPDTRWRKLNETEYTYTMTDDGKKAVDFTLEPPRPNKLHKIRVYNSQLVETKYTGICKLDNGKGQVIEDWMTIDDVMFKGAEWQVEIK